jgi:predicted DNA-binding WGR domain protein
MERRRIVRATGKVPSSEGRSIYFVNRLCVTDSRFALDVRLNARDNGAMKDADEIAGYKLQMLMLERRDTSRNMARFDVLAIEPTLFGDSALVREWDRLGSTGRRRLDLHANPDAAIEALDIWLGKGAEAIGLGCKRRSGVFARIPTTPSTACSRVT